jgi:hypothetical protein
MADIFAYLNGLILPLQGKSVTVLNVQDKVNAAIMKTDRWVTLLDIITNRTLSKPLMTFVVASGEELEPQVTDIMKEHLCL